MMNLDDALLFAQQCKDNAACSTSGKALVALLDELERYRKIHPDTVNLIFENISARSGKLPRHVESILRGGPIIYQD